MSRDTIEARPEVVTDQEASVQAVHRLAARVGRGRNVAREAAVTRVRVREVAATISGQPQERAGGRVMSFDVDTSHPGQ
jgi:hypothetical protein